MNNKIIYLGSYCDKLLYYDEFRDEFYAIDIEEGFIDFEKIDEFSFVDQGKNLSEFRITNPNEIKALKYFYESEKIYQEKVRRMGKSIKEMQEKCQKNQSAKAKRSIGRAAFIGLFPILLLNNSKIEKNLNIIVDTIEESIEQYQSEHQNDEKHLEDFYKGIDANNTISDELKQVLKADFNVLVESDIYIPDMYVPNKFSSDGICFRLRYTNFKGYNENNYINQLAYILFGNNDTISKCVVRELDEYANNRESSKESILFSFLRPKDKIGLVSNMFVYGSDHYIKDVAKYYGVNEKDIKELIKLLDKYEEAETFEEKANIETSYNRRLANIFSDYYHDKKNLNDIDKYILASQVYNGKFKYDNNLFSDTTTITYDDSNYGEYKLYFDSQTGADISCAIYYPKLVELIRNKGNNLDYNDPDCRFLLYLTALACDDKLYYYNDEITSSRTPEELAHIIYDRVFSVNTGFTNLKPQVLYAYLSNGTICINDIFREMNIPDDEAFSLALYVEFDKCLRKDIEEGNLSEEDYQSRLEWILKWISKDGEKVYNILTNALNTNSSLFSELKLYPFTYSYANEDIKEYIYIPEK